MGNIGSRYDTRSGLSRKGMAHGRGNITITPNSKYLKFLYQTFNLLIINIYMFTNIFKIYIEYIILIISIVIFLI